MTASVTQRWPSLLRPLATHRVWPAIHNALAADHITDRLGDIGAVIAYPLDVFRAKKQMRAVAMVLGFSIM